MSMKTFVAKYFLITFTAVLLFADNALFAQKYDPKETDQKLNAALQIIRSAYFDTVNEPNLVEKAIIEMLKEMDPHSVYISEKEVKETNEPLLGNFEGIGVSFNIFKDTILVISAIPGGPSEKLGILAGDKIVKIDGEDATGRKINNDYVFKKLRGDKGTEVKVSILRIGKKGLIDYKIIRDKIPINSIDASYMAAANIGYVKLNRFSRTSVTEFKKSIADLKKQGLKNLILDLRGNSGGYLDIANELADEFLGSRKLIVFTKGLHSPRNDYMATERGNFEKGKLVVLIDENSASASEIIAGAVQDWDRGLLIGRRSFGKGLVQRPYNLPDGSVIRLTTARYYTPTGRCIQMSYSEGVEQYYKNLMGRYKHGELVNPDSIKIVDSLKFYTPNKRVVYGGGGIMPDIFIPLDTGYYSDYYSDLWRKGLLTQFCIEFVNNNRDSLKVKYPAVNDYIKGFIMDSVFMNKFSDYCEKDSLKKNDEQMQKSLKYIKIWIKAIIARDMWDICAEYQVINSIDECYLKALEVLQDNTFKKMNVQWK